MRTSPSLALCSCAFLALAAGAKAQQAQQSSLPPPAAVALIQKSVAVTGSGTAIADVTSTGTVIRTVGPDTQPGTIILKALAPDSSQCEIVLSNGTLTETRGFNSSGMPAISSAGAHGVVQAGSVANTFWPAAWFSPALLLARAMAPGAQTFYDGPESLNGAQVVHASVVASSPLLTNAADAPPMVLSALTRMNTFDLYFDPATSLLKAAKFTIHPDSTAGIDIPVEADFSDYRSVAGVQTPFHIQKLVNGVLQLDISVVSATVNSGLQPADFSVE